MPVFNANALMRELRKARGLTQEQLAEGLCSRSTIAMIEKGQRKPDWYIFSGAMQKLNVDPTQFYSDIASEEEMSMYDYLSDLYALYGSNDCEALKSEIEKMESDKKFSAGLWRKVYLEALRFLYASDDYKNHERLFEASIESIKMNRPDFDIEKIEEYSLTNSELALLDSIASVYANMQDIEKSIKILRKVVEYYEKTLKYMRIGVLGTMAYAATVTNFADVLLKAKAYEECIDECDKVIKLTTGLDYATRSRIKAVECKAFAFTHLGKKEEGEILYKKHLFYYWAISGYMDVTNTIFDKEKERWEEAFGYKLDLSLPW